MKWYAVIYNRQGNQLKKSITFSFRSSAVDWAETFIKNQPGATYQIFEA